MTAGRRSFLRENAFLVAAAALPLIVALLFLAASTIPSLTVPDPGYDLVFRAAHPYTSNPSAVSVDFIVRDGQVDAVVRLAPPQSYPPRWALLRFDHQSGQVREIPLDLPALVPEGETVTVRVEALAGDRIIDGAVAPDGYRLATGRGGGAGIVGGIFGIGRSRAELALEKDGRVIEIELPPPFDTGYAQIAAIGWIAGEER